MVYLHISLIYIVTFIICHINMLFVLLTAHRALGRIHVAFQTR